MFLLIILIGTIMIVFSICLTIQDPVNGLKHDEKVKVIKNQVHTIIYVLTQKLCNVTTNNKDNFWGFGDVIRGMIATGMFAKKHGCKYIIDMSLHPMSKWFVPIENEFTSYIKKFENDIHFVYPDKLREFYDQQTDEIMLVFTNDHHPDIVDEDVKNYVKSMFIPINEVFKVKQIPTNQYHILHFRLGDECMVRNNADTSMMLKLVDLAKKHKDINMDQYLFSDCKSFKELLKNEFLMNDTNIVHIGYEKNPDNMIDTIFEFMMLKNAEKIKTFSMYGWVSGFVKSISVLYDVPIEKIT